MTLERCILLFKDTAQKYNTPRLITLNTEQSLVFNQVPICHDEHT